MSGFLNHLRLELKVGIRNPGLQFMLHLFPIGFVTLMGLVMVELNPVFKDTMTASMPIFGLMVGPLLALPPMIVEQREQGVFRSYRVHGLPSLAVATIPGIAFFVHTLALSIVLTVMCVFLFGGAAPISWIGFILALVPIGLVFCSLGLVIGVVSSSNRTATVLSQAIFLPSMLIGGLMVPASVLPEKLQTAAYLLPSSHAMEFLFDLGWGMQDRADTLGHGLVLVATAMLAIISSIVLFRWDQNTQPAGRHWSIAIITVLPVAIFVLGGI